MIYYDFHIHSCLSPCADDDMTPHNIAGMGLSKLPEGADVIIGVLFALSIVGAVVGYRLTCKASEDIPKLEEMQEETVTVLEEANTEV